MVHGDLYYQIVFVIDHMYLQLQSMIFLFPTWQDGYSQGVVFASYIRYLLQFLNLLSDMVPSEFFFGVITLVWLRLFVGAVQLVLRLIDWFRRFRQAVFI